jgi:hypothetical protein
MAKALRGVLVRVSSTDPVLLGWLADGFSVEQLLEAVQLARQYKPAPEPLPARYLDKVLRSRGDANGAGSRGWDAAREQRAAALTGRDAAGGNNESIDGEFREV